MDKTIPEPITREEQYLAAAAGYNVEPPEPITRKELFLAKLAGMDVEVPATYTRSELFVEAASERSAKAVIQPLEISENGTYTAPAGVDGYNPVVVDVEPVLQDKTITENGEYTADAGFDGLGKVLVEIAGAGGSVVCKTGTFTADSKQNQIIQHDLCTTPALIVVYPSGGSTGKDYELTFAYGISQNLANKTGITKDYQYAIYTYSNSPRQATPDYVIDSSSTSAPFRLADANTITSGYSSAMYTVGSKYTWLAIGIIE